jgi:hypothetical protein
MEDFKVDDSFGNASVHRVSSTCVSMIEYLAEKILQKPLNRWM